MNDLRLIIFDFDGTIANTLDLGLAIANDLSTTYGYKNVSKEELIHYRNLSTRQALKRAGVNLLKLPFIAKDFRRELGKRIDRLQPVDGMPWVIAQLNSQSYLMGIITSNSTKNVVNFLERNSLLNMFRFIYPQQGLFNKRKVLQSVLRKEKLSPRQVLYVGDETRDIKAARKCLIPVAAVGWGLNTKHALTQHNPDFLLDSPVGLLHLVDQITSLHSSVEMYGS